MKTENERTLDGKSIVSRDIILQPWSGARRCREETHARIGTSIKKVQHVPDHCLFSADNIPYIRKLIPVFSVYMGSTDGLA
jgi:hypothetical protein